MANDLCRVHFFQNLVTWAGILVLWILFQKSLYGGIQKSLIDKMEPKGFADERFRKRPELPLHIPTAQECDATMIHQRTNAGIQKDYKS